MAQQHWHLFAVHGVEIEYMIVDRDTLDIRPWADRVLIGSDGLILNEVNHGVVSWCNELARHVVELKCTRPAPALAPLSDEFQRNIRRLNQLLATDNAMLLPGGMHPWMDPDRELVLWPLQNEEIYRAYDQIFSCRGHGWANLQSVQINLPFADDAEFGRLHAAMRFCLPLLCGLAASTPYADGRYSGYADYRMEVYRHNSKRVPQVAGNVVPEAVFSIGDYQRRILQPMYDAIAPLDNEHVLQEDWLNSRGVLPRFERQSIEIRTLDSQECVAADMAIVAAVCALVRALTEERWCSYAEQQAVADAPLVALFQASLRDAEHCPVATGHWQRLLGLPARDMTLGQLWGHVLERLASSGLLNSIHEKPLHHILSQGTLASRLLKRTGTSAGRTGLQPLYHELAQCLHENHLLHTH